MRIYRCNPRCFNAVSKECHCQCNGINHGVGETQARANFAKLGLSLKTTPAPRRPSMHKRRVLHHDQQTWLFPSGRYWAANQVSEP